jgi:hypothetical protein
MYVDKVKMLAIVIQIVESEIEQLQTGLAHAKHAKRESPGRMQSRYDTMGIEAGWVADGLCKTLGEKMESLRLLNQFRFVAETNRVGLGSLVGIGSRNGMAQDFYFILPGAGGVSITWEDNEINIITPQAPIARKISGKMLGNEIMLDQKKLESLAILVLE